MNAQHLFKENAMHPELVGGVCHAEARSGHSACAIRILENPIAQRKALTSSSLGVVAVHQPGKVQAELVPVAFGVRTLHFAKLALKARVHDGLCFSRLDLSYISVVPVIKKRKERRERIAIFKAKPASMTDLERPLDLLVEPGCVPVFFLGR